MAESAESVTRQISDRAKEKRVRVCSGFKVNEGPDGDRTSCRVARLVAGGRLGLLIGSAGGYYYYTRLQLTAIAPRDDNRGRRTSGSGGGRPGVRRTWCDKLVLHAA